MAGICEGDWLKSTIKNVDDGTVEIKEGAGGVLTGKHKKSKKDIIGHCTEGASPHIRFARMGDDGCFYVYDGDIDRVTTPVPKLVIKNGTVTKACRPDKREARLTLADDWTAEKPT